MRQPCDGGPADGAKAVGARGKFRWISADDRGAGHGWSGPGVGRGLYRDEGDGRWAYCGAGARQCRGCGGYITPSGPANGVSLDCPICGAD